MTPTCEFDLEAFVTVHSIMMKRKPSDDLNRVVTVSGDWVWASRDLPSRPNTTELELRATSADHGGVRQTPSGTYVIDFHLSFLARAQS